MKKKVHISIIYSCVFILYFLLKIDAINISINIVNKIKQNINLELCYGIYKILKIKITMLKLFTEIAVVKDCLNKFIFFFLLGI